MNKLALSLTFIFFINLNAEALPILDRYYKVLPESQSHTQHGLASQRELDSESIKVFVWNIKKTQQVGWRQEFENYSEKQDIFLLQEVYQNDLFNTTTNSMNGIRWDMGISFMYRMYNDTPTGTMIGSSVEPSFIKVRHSIDSEPLVGTPKSMTFAKYPVSGQDQTLLVISVHGINLTDYDSFRKQMIQAEEEITKHKGPVVFAGDFNTRTKGRTNYLFEMVKRLKLETVNFKNAEYRMVWKFTKNYLDHGFIRGLSVKSAEVIKESRGSDHKPLALELAIAK